MLLGGAAHPRRFRTCSGVGRTGSSSSVQTGSSSVPDTDRSTMPRSPAVTSMRLTDSSAVPHAHGRYALTSVEQRSWSIRAKWSRLPMMASLCASLACCVSPPRRSSGNGIKGLSTKLWPPTPHPLPSGCGPADNWWVDGGRIELEALESLDRGGRPRVLDKPVESVVGDLLPARLAYREVRAVGELLVVRDRGGLPLEALGWRASAIPGE